MGRYMPLERLKHNFINKILSYQFRNKIRNKKINIHKSCDIDIDHNKDFIGEGTVISAYSQISSSNGGMIKIGNNCEIGRGVLILSYGGKIIIGDNCSFNPYTLIYGHGGLTIGNNVRIAAHTVIIPANHVFINPNKIIREQGLTTIGITIKNDVWIGAGAKILDGVTIETGSVIGAGAVVTKSTQPFSINAGVPAKEICNRRQVR